MAGVKTLRVPATPNRRDVAMPKFARQGRPARSSSNSILAMWRQLGDWWKAWDDPSDQAPAAETTPHDLYARHNDHFCRASDMLRDAIMLQPAASLAEARIQLRLTLDEVDRLLQCEFTEEQREETLRNMLAALTSAICVIESGQPALPGEAANIYRPHADRLYFPALRPGARKGAA